MDVRDRTLLCFAALTAIFVVALVLSSSAEPSRSPTETAPLSALWEPPADLANRDLFNGFWGSAHAPDPDAVYTYVAPKTSGTNPGLIVRDPLGRQWNVKQAPHNDNG